MATFVHLAPESAVVRIRRSGMRRSRTRYGTSGVYATPVMRRFFATHQWLRELKRYGGQTIVGVYFKIPDDEPVLVGHYGTAHASMTAAEAVAFFATLDDPRGYEVIVPRRVRSDEIRKIRALPQVVGWRYWPEAHGHPPALCPLCVTRGGYGAAAIRRRFDEAER